MLMRQPGPHSTLTCESTDPTVWNGKSLDSSGPSSSGRQAGRALDLTLFCVRAQPSCSELILPLPGRGLWAVGAYHQSGEGAGRMKT
jgi:hypothetical protein